MLGKDKISSGCQSDLHKATQLAEHYVRHLCMTDSISLISQDEQSAQMSEQFRFQVDNEVQRILKESYERVKGLLESNQKRLERVAGELVKRETLSIEEVKEILDQEIGWI